jgi:hypothetical protein
MANEAEKETVDQADGATKEAGVEGVADDTNDGAQNEDEVEEDE